MLRDPQPILQAVFDNIRLPPFDDCEAHLVVLDAHQMALALEMAVEVFSQYVPSRVVRANLGYVNPQLCFGITAGELLIGAYLVSENSLRIRGENLPKLEHRPALQGEALVVHRFARRMGFGQTLRHMLPEVGRLVGADYVWGGALHELHNLDHWLRRRVLIRSSGGTHFTVEPIAADLKEALLPLANEPLRDRWMGELGLNTLADDTFSQLWPAP
jgi:hypothetical protein